MLESAEGTDATVRSGPLPITSGSIRSFAEDPIRLMRSLHAEHGAYAALDDVGSRVYFGFSPDHNHQVLSDPQTFHSCFFAIRGPRESSQRRLTCGLLSMNGEVHKRQRRLVQQAFNKRALLGYYPRIQALVEEMLSRWKLGQERDVARDMTEFMLKLTGDLLFGSDNFELACKIGKMTEEWIEMNHNLGVGALISDEEVTRAYQKILDHAARLEAKIRELIENRRQVGAAGTDILSLLTQAHDEEGLVSDDVMVGQAALLFAAAHMTTAHSLSWTLFLLAQHPRVMRSLWQELVSVLSGRFPGPEDSIRLPAMRRIVKESMRVLPASAYSQRIATRPVQVGPFQVGTGAVVIFSQFMTHHLPDLYPQPEAFDPDRWADLDPSPYAYLPFGSGPRMCIGGPLALVILSSVVPAIVQRFRLRVVPGAEITGKVISTMLSPTTGVPISLERHDGRFSSSRVCGNIHELVTLHGAE